MDKDFFGKKGLLRNFACFVSFFILSCFLPYSSFADESPSITSIDPISGLIGKEIHIYGSNFGSYLPGSGYNPVRKNRGTNYMEFHDGIVTEIITWSDTEIVCTVPVGNESGPVKE